MESLKKFFTSTTFKIILIKALVYAVIFILVLNFMFKTFWGESLFEII